MATDVIKSRLVCGIQRLLLGILLRGMCGERNIVALLMDLVDLQTSAPAEIPNWHARLLQAKVGYASQK